MLGQGRRGLVEDQDVGLDGEGAGDRHHRALGRRQLADLARRARRRRRRASSAAAARRRASPQAIRPSAARVAGDQGHVLGHRHAVDEAQILVDEADRQPVDAGCRPAGRAGGPRRRPRVCTPARILIRVDLPAPFSPRRAVTSPAGSSRSTLSSASVPPKRLVRPLAARSGVVIGSVGGDGPYFTPHIERYFSSYPLLGMKVFLSPPSASTFSGVTR